MNEISKTQKYPESGKFSYLRDLQPDRMDGIVGMLKCGLPIDKKDLAAALRHHGNRPLPTNVFEYLCDALDGKVKKKRGRKSHNDVEGQQRKMLMAYDYSRYLAWLQHRLSRYSNLDGWAAIRNVPWCGGEPHIRAAKMVNQKYTLNLSDRRILDIVRTRKKRSN